MCTVIRLVKWATPALALMTMMIGSAGVLAQPYGSCPVGGYAIPACPVASDAVIRDQIQSRLSGSVASRGYPVTIGVCDGVVTLRGTVETQGRVDLANLFAWSVPGVIQVNNQLLPDPGVRDDMTLIGQVRQAMNRRPIDTNRIEVRVNEGVVELSGVVRSEMARDMAFEAAWSVPGVRAVYNNLTIRAAVVSEPF